MGRTLWAHLAKPSEAMQKSMLHADEPLLHVGRPLIMENECPNGEVQVGF